ncbi:carboxypeptidase-like regulatory domain-containing protein [Bremerella sp. T1]|uniref:carboxypeptidase-like regulatory domain-containing protein n=1 Tax=Bremerella sp. TYQ1 TaxID=3119568 RepID=UPI001CCDC184|nr:carboxypeptidase-like regulatory domain-containing protein [Bremerella volcania]UBM38478.1 carboxypeptidase-like regulatory domain-containing protein [Bremerella volcania]
MKSSILSGSLCALLVALLCVGCTSEAKVYSGTVSLDGNPLENAGVQLIANSSSARGEHYSTTDSSGKFTIASDPNNPITAGEYSVVVDKVPAEMGGQSIVPNQYRSQEKTPLKVSISADQTTIPAIELKSKS